jgi:hypothetical protein
MSDGYVYDSVIIQYLYSTLQVYFGIEGYTHSLGGCAEYTLSR